MFVCMHHEFCMHANEIKKLMKSRENETNMALNVFYRQLRCQRVKAKPQTIRSRQSSHLQFLRTALATSQNDWFL